MSRRLIIAVLFVAVAILAFAPVTNAQGGAIKTKDPLTGIVSYMPDSLKSKSGALGLIPARMGFLKAAATGVDTSECFDTLGGVFCIVLAQVKCKNDSANVTIALLGTNDGKTFANLGNVGAAITGSGSLAVSNAYRAFSTGDTVSYYKQCALKITNAAAAGDTVQVRLRPLVRWPAPSFRW